MSTWRRRFSRKLQRSYENDEILIRNAMKYRKRLQSATNQIQRTRRFTQKNLDNSDAEIHVARLINDIGQLSDCRPLQEISSLVDSLAMRQQLSYRIFHEYGMSALQQGFEKLNDDLTQCCDQTKSVLREEKSNNYSNHTKTLSTNRLHDEWSKHQKLAIQQFKQGLSSYCDIGLSNLKIQTVILERLQKFVDQLSEDDAAMNGLPNFAADSLEIRREIDTMLRITLDRAPIEAASESGTKRPKFLQNHLTFSNSVYSHEITESVARSHRQSADEQLNSPNINQYPLNIPIISNTPALHNHSTTTTTNEKRCQIDTNSDHLPSYTDLFATPRRNTRFNQH